MKKREEPVVADARRQEIVAAARGCFLQFGYAKTSLEDIARRAHLSRPLIYLKFKNKEEVLSGVLEDLFAAQAPRARAAVAAPGSSRERLLQLYEVFLLEPWGEISQAPMAHEFYEACLQLAPEVEEKQEKFKLKLTQELLGSRALAEVFVLAVEGLTTDLPTTAVLRKRVALLVERFA